MPAVWTVPEHTGTGRVPAHAITHRDRVDLNGRWDFQLLPTPMSTLGESWSSITVPGAWTMQGFDDLPIYTNVRMPFAELPPQVPAQNPTGVHRRAFTVPESWAGRRVVLHVGAAESLLLVRVNGREIGTSTDSHLAAEFDITHALRPGGNELVLTVVKWSAASYLEDQDQWWHGGITRDVYLYATGPTYLGDLTAVADYDSETGHGALDLTVHVAGQPRAELTVRARIRDVTATGPVPERRARELPAGDDIPPELEGLDPFGLHYAALAGQPMPEQLRPVADALRARMFPAPAGRVTLRMDLPAITPWTAETPALHELVIELLDADDTVLETVTERIGFRRVEIRDGDLLVNGRRIWIAGVNRHDFHPRTGRTLTRADLERELALLKRHNVNAIRTAHYPNQPEFLELTDEYGFYVFDEADIECHDFASTLCDDPGT
ncbi:sugar-binding domain-containing protein [Nocardia sp. CDC160]|uniref:sugar-binding domain-containing protein n=1 Tax=Nocardia sp. CDC160 TaxID=3112166 RepID=UPI002DB96F6C|nr:sugar-binding domain-containing protein [Nocardia sp. CDC160]MEC3916797.1 sugar-binding domain-containing protein [Nocardia sp. CDC160]